MTSPFDYIKSINEHNYALTDPLAEKEYNPYITNINFSLFEDTIFFANEMNCNAHISNKMQYDFYFNSVRPKKRYKKWPKKPTDIEDIKLIAEIYKYNFRKARQVHNVMTDEQLKTLKNNYNKGGL